LLGARNDKIKNNFIEAFSVLIPNSDYNQDNIHNIVSGIYEDLHQIKEHYKQLCESTNVSVKYYKTRIKLSKDFVITDVIKQGQKYDENFNKDFSEEQRKGFEIILVILKSICMYMVELQDLKIDIDKYYKELIAALCIKHLSDITMEQIKALMQKYAKIDYELMAMVFEAKKSEFGDFVEAEVSISPREGKAILVAGANMKELELLLEATKDKGINIYSHGQMITGHNFPKLKVYPHLIGHWGKGAEHFASDFSSFPGPIFLTKLSLFKAESLYSCKIFTSDKAVPTGLSLVKDNDFEPLIKSALFAEGFDETEPEETIKSGIIEQNYLNSLSEILNRIESGEIKYIFVIGVSNKISSQIEYFKKFLSLLKKDCFVISFYSEENVKNLLFNSLDYVFPFLYKALNIFFKLKETFDIKINILYTRCEPHTISNIIYTKNLGVDHIYLYPCSPILINPSLVDFLVELFDIKLYTTPEADLKTMLTG